MPNTRRNLYTLRRSDEELEDLLKGESCEFYVSQTWHDASHLVISHPLCRGFSYLEEGWTSYYEFGAVARAYPTKVRSLCAQILRRTLFRNRLPPEQTFFHRGYQHVYGFTEHSFPNWANRVVLGLPESFRPLPGSSPKTSPVLVFDALVELGKTSFDAVSHAVAKLLDALRAAGEPRLRYKFHGAQTETTSKSGLRNLFALHKEYLSIEELPAETALEAMVSAEDFSMYIFNSAAGLYASLAGRRVISLNNLVREADPAYIKEVRALPDVFATLIQDIHGNGGKGFAV